jgi:folate-dependent tRNA-U54 methylase TrmFO/GidA
MSELKLISKNPLSVADDFSKQPGLRWKKLTPNVSGEEFREFYLNPSFEDSIQNSKKLVVYLDGVEGYTKSFLEEAFGGLARMQGIKKVLENLELISKNQSRIEKIISYIQNADKK